MPPSIRSDFAPILQAMASHPVPIGDVASRRNMMDPVMATMSAAAKKAQTDLEAKIDLRTHLVLRTEEGYEVPVLHYALKTRQTTGITAAVVNMHPGGLITGSAKFMDASIRQHVLETGIQFLDIEYRLAPEYPYPTPQEDCWAALVWIRDHASELGIDPKRIALMGESAGGCLATSLAAHAASTNSMSIAKLILTCPMLDDRTGKETPEEGVLYSWTPGDNITAWDAVLGADRSLVKGEIPPVPASITDVSGFPPTLLQVASGDLFLDEDLALGQLMARQGVDVEMIAYAGVPHGFEAILPDSEPSKRARRDRNRFLEDL